MKRYDVQPLDLMQFINTKYHMPFIHERIELEGALDAGRLAEAMDTLLDLFPLLKCRYDEEANAFVEIEGRSGRDLLRLEETAGREEMLTEALDMREKLMQLTAAGNVLYITVSHLVCDGSGFKELLYLLCDIYNGTLDGDGSWLMKREFDQLNAGAYGGAEIFLMLLSMTGGYKNRPIYAKGGEERAYAAESFLPQEVMQAVHAAAKTQGATLNDVFLTAYARTLSRLYGLRKVKLPCTVDLRKYAAEKTGIANLTGTYTLNVKIRAGEPFRDTLAAVSGKMQKQKRTRNDIVGPALLVSKYRSSSLEDFMKLYGGMETSEYADYTNLGILDEQKLRFGETAVKSAVGYSGVSRAPCFQMAVSTFRGETTVSALFQCAESEREKADRVVAGVADEIRSFTRT